MAASRWEALAVAAALLLGCGGGGDGRPRATATLTAVLTATAVPTTTAPPTASLAPTHTATAAPTEPPTASPSATAVETATAAPTPTATPDESAVATYAGPGPYVVGVTTLNIGDRDIEVWYPAAAGSEAGREKASYASFEVLPAAIQALLPPDLNIVVPMEAYRDLPISPTGPFPVLTFSHGAGGFRQAYSGLLTGIAAHGYVVASLDHLEWGLLKQVGLLPPGVDRSAAEVVRAALDRLAAASADPGSVLAGGVDATRVATAGHSAGGAAAFGLPDAPEVKAMLGFATFEYGRGLAGKPILLLTGNEDAGTPVLEETYEDLAPIKRFVAVDRAAHNSFTDQCAIIHGGNNFLERLVEAGFPIPPQLLALALDGCRPENLAPAAFWKVVQHFTVAHLRAAFGQDEPPLGLGPGIAGAFAPITLRYRAADDLTAPQPGVRDFVVSGFGSVVGSGGADPCPGGFNRNPAEHAPPLAEDCLDPTATQDPLFQTRQVADTVDGFDLDPTASPMTPAGACTHQPFTGPHGEPGIDLQSWRALGCVRGFQAGEIADTVVDQAVRDGSMTILVELRGVDDPVNDDDVRVQVFASADPPPRGADGSILPYGTLSASADARYRGSVGYGRIAGGVLTAGPMDLRVRLNIQIVAGDLTFHDAWLRLAPRPDGTVEGALFGYQPVEELYDIYGRKAGAAGALALGYTCSGLYAALTQAADGDYDPDTGTCASISTGYHFTAVPAFIAR